MKENFVYYHRLNGFLWPDLLVRTIDANIRKVGIVGPRNNAEVKSAKGIEVGTVAAIMCI